MPPMMDDPEPEEEVEPEPDPEPKKDNNSQPKLKRPRYVNSILSLFEVLICTTTNAIVSL